MLGVGSAPSVPSEVKYPARLQHSGYQPCESRYFPSLLAGHRGHQLAEPIQFLPNFLFHFSGAQVGGQTLIARLPPCKRKGIQLRSIDPPKAPRDFWDVLWTVFLDRDGVLNRKMPDGQYVTDWQQFRWIPGSLEALALLAAAPARIVVVTNQQGVAKGLLTAQRLEDIHRKMKADVAAAGGRIDGIYVCPHLEGSCDCRKPGIGLFLHAKRDFPDTNFCQSVVVGDSQSDIEAGKRLGAWTVLVGPPLAMAQEERHAAAPDLRTAAEQVLLPLFARYPANRR